MKKIDLNTFICRLMDELKDFEESQLLVVSETEKSSEQWMNSFLVYSGYQDLEDTYSIEQYEEDFDYIQDYQYEESILRKKYRSFRDDERF